MRERESKPSIQLVPWSTRWAARFADEKERWQRMLGSVCLDVEHIGSTAIEGIMAKPIVDVLVVVTSHEEIVRMTAQILEHGYRTKGEHGIPGRRYFQRDEDGERAFHIHAYEQGHSAIASHIRFRDFLRSDKSTAREYERLKIELAQKFRDLKSPYSEAKGSFIEGVLASLD